MILGGEEECRRRVFDQKSRFQFSNEMFRVPNAKRTHLTDDAIIRRIKSKWIQISGFRIPHASLVCYFDHPWAFYGTDRTNTVHPRPPQHHPRTPVNPVLAYSVSLR